MDYELVEEEQQVRIPIKGSVTFVGDIMEYYSGHGWEFIGSLQTEDYIYARFRRRHVYGPPQTETDT